MIDDFTIFSRSGLILWRKSFVKLRGNPLGLLVQTVLLEDRVALAELVCDGYTVRWVLENEAGLVFSVIYQTALPPAYAADLLVSVKAAFIDKYSSVLGDSNVDDFSDFSVVFESLLNAAEDRSLSRAAALRSANVCPTISSDAMSTVATSSSWSSSSLPSADTEVPETSSYRGNSKYHSLKDEAAEQCDDNDVSHDLSEDTIRQNREAFIRRKQGSGGRPKKSSSKAAGSSRSLMGGLSSTSDRLEVPKRNALGSIPEENEKLDFSDDKSQEAVTDNIARYVSDAEVARCREQHLDAKPNTAYDIISADDDQAADSNSSNVRGKVFDFFKGLAGMKMLTRTDLERPLSLFRDVLIGKNVAQDIADRLIESVASSLEGKRMESLTTVSATVRQALDDALTRILTPRQSVDIVAEIAAKRGTGRPYVIAFCGVNGVGKSTSLAKVCYYLLNNNCKVMIAACDTFRAGAVEQLRTHVRCLGENAELFDRGYGKDAASVAMDAIRKAREHRFDVVLVDTAGRMQDNEPLMRALSKLVEVNQPDRLFFVGEALVGNDAVDQLSKFNAALADHQKSAKPRLIDGIVLTKFDTIDDKVGAAVSMVYTTGQPIVFVGVGQTYMDLRKVNTKSLVKALLK